MKTLAHAVSVAIVVLVAAAPTVAAPTPKPTPYRFSITNRTAEPIQLSLEMRTTASLGRVTIAPDVKTPIEVRGRPDFVVVRSKHCNVTTEVPVPNAHIYGGSVIMKDGVCSIYLYAQG